MKKLILLAIVMLLGVSVGVVLAQDDAEAPADGGQSTIAPAAGDGTDDAGWEDDAEGDATDGAEGDGELKKEGPNMIWLLVMMMVVMYFFVFRGPKKRQKEHQKMLQELEKNTRIRTIGGIMGTVVDTRDDEVIIKIDESNNTKMRIARSAISKVITEEEDKKN